MCCSDPLRPPLTAVIRPFFPKGSFDALSCRSLPEIRSFGPERLLSPKADTDEKSVYFCYAGLCCRSLQAQQCPVQRTAQKGVVLEKATTMPA